MCQERNARDKSIPGPNERPMIEAWSLWSLILVILALDVEFFHPMTVVKI